MAHQIIALILLAIAHVEGSCVYVIVTKKYPEVVFRGA
jgi:hypothetical protein